MKSVMMLLSLLLVILVEGCQSLPPHPEGQICVFNSVTLVSHCYMISPQMVHRHGIEGSYYVNIQTGAGTETPASQMTNWITMDPDSWGSIETYLNKLSAQDKQCLDL